MLQLGLLIGLILGFLLRGWLGNTFPWLFRRKRKDGSDDDTPGGKPRGLVDRVSTFFLDGIFKPKNKDSDKKGK